VGSDMFFVVEFVEFAPDAHIGVVINSRTHGFVVWVDPLFHFYCTGAVVEFVGYVCGLS